MRQAWYEKRRDEVATDISGTQDRPKDRLHQMSNFPWSEISPDEFEHLCYQLIGGMGFENVEWIRGPADRGRDIRAEKVLELFPGRVKRERWTIECKRHVQSAVDQKDLVASIAWAEVHDPDRFLIITCGHLSVAARDWLDGRNEKRRSFEVLVIEGPLLEELCAQNLDIVKKFFKGEDRTDIAKVRSEYFADLRGIWKEARADSPDDRTRQLHRHHVAWSTDHDGSGRHFRVIYPRQAHTVEYLETGITRSVYRIEMANIGTRPVTSERFTLRGDQPAISNDEMNLKVSSLTSGVDIADISFPYDDGHLKTFEFPLPKEILPLRSHRYEVRVDWPFRASLEGFRYYEVPVFFFTGRLDIQIRMPSNFLISAETLFEEETPWSKTVERPTVTGRVVSASLDLPVVGRTYKAGFVATRRSAT